MATKTFSKPIVLAINICDEIIRDEASKKLSLIGLFSNIHAGKFPAKHPSMHVYVSLTDGHGTCQGELRFVNESTDEIMFSSKGKVPFETPLQTIELNFEMKNLNFEGPGTYSVEFFCDDQLVGRRQFVVTGTPDDEE